MNMRLFLKRGAPGLALIVSMVGVAQSAQAQVPTNLTMQYGTGTTTYSVVNVGSGPATIVATYYNPNGTTPAGSGSTYSVPQFGRVNVTAGTSPDGPLPTNWSGSVVLSSDQDIIASALTPYTGRANAESPEPNSTPGTESSAYEAFNAGSTALYVPTIVRVRRSGSPGVAQLSTRYTFQNTTNTPATLFFTYRTTAGNVYNTTASLAGYGSVTYDTTQAADLPHPSLATQTSPVVMSLLVTSTQPIVGVAEQSWDFDSLDAVTAVPIKQNWSADYTAIPGEQASTTLFGPLVAKIGRTVGISRTCTWGGFTSHQFYTQSSIQNTGTTTATVTAQFIRSNTGTGANAPSGLASFSITFQLGPNATWNFNTFNGGGVAPVGSTLWSNFVDGYNTTTGVATHCNWSGSVRFTSDQPLVGFGFIQQPLSDQNYASAFNFFSASGATSTAFVPQFDRVCTSCAPAAVEDFTSFSSLTVQNVGNANTDLTVEFFGSSGGAPVATITTLGSGGPITLAPGQQYSFNSRNGANASIAQTALLGNNFKGSVRVIASGGVPIRVFVNSLSGKNHADAFVGFNR